VAQWLYDGLNEPDSTLPQCQDEAMHLLSAV